MRTPLVLIGLVIFVLGWLVPGHFPPWTSFQQQWVVSLGVCILALAAALQRATVQWHALALVPLALALVPWLQFASGQLVFLSDAFLPSLFLLAFAVATLSSNRLASDLELRWPDALMLALLVAALCSLGLAMLQWLRVPVSDLLLDHLPPGGRPFANLSQPNHLATLFALGLAACVHFFERSRLGALSAALLAACLGFGLVMTQSRTAWAFLALLAIWWFAKRRHLRLQWPAVTGGLAAFAIGVWCWEWLNEWLLLGAPQLSLGRRAESELRFGVWRALAEAIANAPWLGWGWNQVPVAQLSIAYDHDAGHRAFHNSHNLAIDLAIWTGVPLTVVVLSLVGYWIWRQTSECKDGGHWASLLAIAAIGSHALTEYPLDYAYFLLTLGLLVGVAQSIAPVGRAWTTSAWVLAAPWAVCAPLLLWVGSEYMKVEQSTRDVRLMMAGVGLDKVPNVPPPDTRLLDAIREYHRFMITPPRAGMTEAELAWVRSVAQRNPYPPSLVRYAAALALNGKPDESSRVLRAICNLHEARGCKLGHDQWRAAQAEHPALARIAMP